MSIDWLGITAFYSLAKSVIIWMMKTKKNKNFKLGSRYAHRGFHNDTDAPENSLAAFRRAAELGMHSELDVHRIADGTLVVFHDDTLSRMTGARGYIADYDLSNLRKLKLGETDERIPTFDEVLDIFEDSGLSLLIELKVDRGNQKKLCEAVARRLRRYRGDYAVQSFYPKAIVEYKRQMPGDTVGQLSKNYFNKDDGVVKVQAAKTGNLLFNLIVRPDFVAYKFKDSHSKALHHAIRRKNLTKLAWTIRTPAAYKAAVRTGCIPIFEGFNPNELK